MHVREHATVLVPVVCCTAMVLVGLWGLDRGSMWQDESATFEVAHRSAGQILAMLRNVDVVHGAYYLFMHLWLLPGGGEVWMRIPSVIGMAAAAGAVAALGARLTGERVGLVGGLLFSAMPLASFYAQEGRSTALVTALVLVATLLLVVVAQACAAGRHRSRARRWWLGYAGVMAVAVVLHEFAVLAFIAHATTLLLNRVRRGVLARWVATAAVCGVLVLPTVIVSKAQSGQVGWLSGPDQATLTELGRQLFGGNVVLLVVTIPLVLVALVGDLHTGSASDEGSGQDDGEFDAAPADGSARAPGAIARWSMSSVAVPLLLLPLMVLLGVSLVQPLFHIRYVLFVLAAVPLLVARGIAIAAQVLVRATGHPGLEAVACVAVVAVLVGAQLPNLIEVRTIGSRNNDLAAAADVVGAHGRTGDAVLFMPLRYRAAALAYSEDFTRVDDIALDKSGVEAANLRGTDRSRRHVREAMLARDRIWVVGRSDLDVRAGEKGAQNEQAVLRAEFTKTATYSMHGMQVALFERKPTA